MNSFLVNLLRTLSGSNALYFSVCFWEFLKNMSSKCCFQTSPNSVIWEQRVILHDFKSFISTPFWFTSEDQNSIYGEMSCPKAESYWTAHSSVLTYLGSLFFFSLISFGFLHFPVHETCPTRPRLLGLSDPASFRGHVLWPTIHSLAFSRRPVFVRSNAEYGHIPALSEPWNCGKQES